jgi:hypothetical protein
MSVGNLFYNLKNGNKKKKGKKETIICESTGNLEHYCKALCRGVN